MQGGAHFLNFSVMLKMLLGVSRTTTTPVPPGTLEVLPLYLHWLMRVVTSWDSPQSLPVDHVFSAVLRVSCAVSLRFGRSYAVLQACIAPGWVPSSIRSPTPWHATETGWGPHPVSIDFQTRFFLDQICLPSENLPLREDLSPRLCPSPAGHLCSFIWQDNKVAVNNVVYFSSKAFILRRPILGRH